MTTESEAVVREAVDSHGLGGTWVVVDPIVWEEWGVANSRRPELPLPGTVVVGADGVVDSVDLYSNYMKRRPALDTVSALGETRPSAGAAEGGEAAVDFAAAVSLRSRATSEGVVLYLDIAEGFTVYGAKEKQAVPLTVELLEGARGRARLPPGERKVTATGTQRVLTGAVGIPIRIKQGPAIVEGLLRYQVCYETLCAPPTEARWAIQR